MSTRIDPREYLALEAVLVRSIQKDWAVQAKTVAAAVQAAIERKAWDEALAAAQTIDLSDVGQANKDLAYTVFRGCIEFGSRIAAGGKSLVSSLWFTDLVKQVVHQWLQSLEWSVTQQMQKDALQLIAQAQADEREVVVKKAAPIRPFVSFRQDGDDLLQMISALHTSRLSSWGFIAESDMRGLTTYKLNAVLDNRTSEFCRFIHGKTFTIEEARPVIEQGIHADDPNALREIQPWPKQTKAALASYQGMSSEELVANKMHVPPFHPGCRTMMVRIKDDYRMRKPKEKPVGPELLGEFVSSQQTFADMGIKLSPKDVEFWNDYVKLNPVDVLQVFSGKSVESILGGEVGAAVKVGSTGMIKIAWQLIENKIKTRNLVELDPYAGLLYLSKKGALASPEVAAYIAASKQFGHSVAANQMVLPVARGEAMLALSEGFIPDAMTWQSVRMDMLDRLEGPLKAAFDSLSSPKRFALLNVLNSTNEVNMPRLLKIDLPTPFLSSLLEETAYTGFFTL